MIRPKPDKRLEEAVVRLRNNFDFQVLLKHLTAEYEWLKESLVSSDPAATPSTQGRAAQQRDLLALLNKEPTP